MNRQLLNKWYSYHQKARWVMDTHFPGQTEIQQHEFLYHYVLTRSPSVVKGEEIDIIMLNLRLNDGIIWTNRT